MHITRAKYGYTRRGNELKITVNKQSKRAIKPPLRKCTSQHGISASLFSMPYLVEPQIHRGDPRLVTTITNKGEWLITSQC